MLRFYILRLTYFYSTYSRSRQLLHFTNMVSKVCALKFELSVMLFENTSNFSLSLYLVLGKKEWLTLDGN